MMNQTSEHKSEESYPTAIDSMESSEEEVKDLEKGSPEATEEARKSLRTIQAIQWPPRSPLKIAKNGIKWVRTIALPMELIFLVAFLWLCYKTPEYIVEQHERPILYQTTAAGDVILPSEFSHPHVDDQIFPGPRANLWTVYIPLAFYWATGNFFGPKGDAHAMFSVYLLAIALKIFLVESLKNYVGYQRPDFFNSACKFDNNTLDCGPNGPSHHGFESFPSGHAATAMTSGVVWSLYLFGKVVGLSRQRQRHQRYWAPSFFAKLVLVLTSAPIMLGIYISASRITDNWHSPADVVTGMVLGTGTAVLAHVLYYPSVLGKFAGIPRTTVAEFGGARDEDNHNDEDDDGDDE